MEHQDGTLIRSESPKPAFELITIGDVARVVADGGLHHRREVDFDRPTPTPANGVEAGVHGQPMEPRIETVRVAQARKVAPGPDVGVLDGVASELLVPDDEASDGFQPGDGRVDERGEGVMIASACLLDEIALVHCHPRDAAFGPR
jgi:hypothetical protein